MTEKLFNSELKLMEILWENEPIIAKELTLLANEAYGWNKNTTYTVIVKLVKKGIVNREEPNFICTSKLKKNDYKKNETSRFIDNIFNGSRKAFFASFLEGEELTNEDIKEFQKLIDKKKK